MKTIKFTLLAAMMAVGGSLFAREYNMEAFKHVGIGVEAGLMGAGVELSMPVVTNHLVLKAGYNFLPLKYDMDLDVSIGSLNDAVTELQENYAIRNIPEVRNLKQFNDETTITATAKLKGFNQFKMMVEYYPWSHRIFHVTLGFMVGPSELFSVEGYTTKEEWSTLKTNLDLLNKAVSNDVINQYPALKQAVEEQIANGFPVQRNNNDAGYQYSIGYDLDGTTYRIIDKDGRGYAKAALEVNKFKPYVGIGFGRAIPKHRVGFQFEIGAWYHGTPKITSPNGDIQSTLSDTDDDDMEGIMDMLNEFQFWPQITFRLTGRIF